MFEAASLLADFGGAAYAALAAALAAEAPRFAADLARSVALSAVTLPDGLVFHPPVAASGATPFKSMTESILSSYTNFRYYAESVSAGVLSEQAVGEIMGFRAARGGSLSGMTRFEGHLDDMPAYGYARAALRLFDEPATPAAERFFVMQAGHAANYASRGTFSASEQLAIYPEDSVSVAARAYLFEYLEGGIDQCVPSLVVSTLTTIWALAFTWWAEPGTLWLAKGAPRRWYAGGFSADRLVTAFGAVSFSSVTQPGAAGAQVCTANVSVSAPPFLARAASAAPLTVVVRMRALADGLSMSGASLSAVEPPGAATLVGFSAANESVVVAVAASAAFAVSASFA